MLLYVFLLILYKKVFLVVYYIYYDYYFRECVYVYVLRNYRIYDDIDEMVLFYLIRIVKYR